MVKEGVMDERTADVPSLQYILTRLQWAAISPLFPPNPWCEWCVKVGHNTGVYVPYSFEQAALFLTYLKTLSVGTAGVQTRDLPLSRPALSQLS